MARDDTRRADEQVADMPLPATVLVAAKDVCTVETENATITYGPPPTP